MTRKSYTRYFVSFRSDRSMDMAAFFDMMRYERGQVVRWDRLDEHAWTVTVESEHFTPDRWASFGMHPTVESEWRS